MILIIAYGNSLRRDDGAGLILAERLEQEWSAGQVEVELVSTHQLTPELALDVARAEVTAVVFVDTRVTPPEKIEPEVQVYPLKTGSLSPSLGHHLHPAALLTYAHLLYGKQPPAWMVTVPGVDFGHGEGLSPVTQQALNSVSGLSRTLLSDM